MNGCWRSRIDQHPRVERAARIDGRLRTAQRQRERIGPLTVIPGPVGAADGVMVGDRATGVDYRVGRRPLDLSPLLQLLAAAGGGEDRVVRRWAIRIHVGEAACDRAG